MKKIAIYVLSVLSITLAVPGIALAHVVVTPAQAGVAEELVFNVSVPNERQSDVTSVRLTLPKGVSDVAPTALAGWTISTSKSGAEVGSITWNGDIPVGQRQDFSFSAQMPAAAAELDWRAYQTYADGTVVHWDQKPNGSDDASGNAGPYSVTKVVNDLNTSTSATSSSPRTTLALTLSIVAIAFSALAFLRTRKK